MEKLKHDNWRNLLGCVIGASCGILGCHYVNNTLLTGAELALARFVVMAFGLIVGCTVGWNYNQLQWLFGTAGAKSARFTKRLLGWLRSRAEERLIAAHARAEAAWASVVTAYHSTIVFFVKIYSVGCWLCSAPGKLAGLLKMSSAARMWATTTATVTLYCCTVMAAVTPVTAFIVGNSVAVKENYRVVGFRPVEWWYDVFTPSIFVAVILTVFTAGMQIGWQFTEGNNGQQIKEFARRSLAGFVAGQFLTYWKFLILGGLGIATLFAYGGTIGGLTLAIIVLPASFAIYFVIGFYRLAKQRGNLLCIGVTGTVTTATAWWCGFVFESDLHAWGVALFAGMLSFVCLKILRLGVTYVVENTEFGEIAAQHGTSTPLKMVVEPAWTHFTRPVEMVLARAGLQ